MLIRRNLTYVTKKGWWTEFFYSVECCYDLFTKYFCNIAVKDIDVSR